MGLPWSIATSLVWSLQCIRQWFDFKLNWNSLNMGSFEAYFSKLPALGIRYGNIIHPTLLISLEKQMVKGLEKQKIHLWPRKSFQNSFRRGAGRTQCVWHPSVENRPWVSFVATNLSESLDPPENFRHHPSETFWKSITAIVRTPFCGRASGKDTFVGSTPLTIHTFPQAPKCQNVSQKGVLFVNSNHTTHGESTCERSKKGRPVLDHADKSCEIKRL